MTWSPGEHMIEVRRTPAPGAARGAWRAFRETLRGMRTTFGRIPEGPVTVQYPEEKVPVYPRFRGRHKLHRFEDTGLQSRQFHCHLAHGAIGLEGALGDLRGLVVTDYRR